METTPGKVKPRHPWLAALLSLLGGGPLGQVYVGRFRRAAILWILAAFLHCVLVFCAVTLTLDRLGFVLLLSCVPAWMIYVSVDAWILAKRERNSPLKRYQRWWMYIVVWGMFLAGNYGCAMATRSSIGEAFVVPARSMSPTIMAGDRILVDKFWDNRSRLRRNDVIVYRRSEPGSPVLVARVIGLPGDRIEIKNEQIFVNGEKWDDRHAVFQGPLPTFLDAANYGPVTIPVDCFFVLGDNRRLSRDSRYDGPIPLSAYYGKACLIYWSRPRQFPDPHDPIHYTLGEILWNRIGTRLD